MKIILLVVLLAISCSTVFNQSMGVKNENGTIEYVQISTNVEVTFDTRNPCEIIPTVLYGGQTYNTVQIGDQCWLKENLNIGNRIAGASDQTDNNILEKYCYGDIDANCTTYGGLYKWAEAMKYQNGATNSTTTILAFSGNIQGICPSGWHIPTKEEFSALKTFVVVGSDLKESGSNTSGFTAKLAGIYDNFTLEFKYHNQLASFWSSSQHNATYANQLSLNTSISIDINAIPKNAGYSVRCIKD